MARGNTLPDGLFGTKLVRLHYGQLRPPQTYCCELMLLNYSVWVQLQLRGCSAHFSFPGKRMLTVLLRPLSQHPRSPIPLPQLYSKSSSAHPQVFPTRLLQWQDWPIWHWVRRYIFHHLLHCSLHTLASWPHGVCSGPVCQNARRDQEEGPGSVYGTGLAACLLQRVLDHGSGKSLTSTLEIGSTWWPHG